MKENVLHCKRLLQYDGRYIQINCILRGCRGNMADIYNCGYHLFTDFGK